MVTKLSQYRRPYLPPEGVTMYQEYLKSHFENLTMPEINDIRYKVSVHKCDVKLRVFLSLYMYVD